MKRKVKYTKHQDGYKIGIIGYKKGKCCGEWCLDCEFIRRKILKKN